MFGSMKSMSPLPSMLSVPPLTAGPDDPVDDVVPPPVLPLLHAAAASASAAPAAVMRIARRVIRIISGPFLPALADVENLPLERLVPSSSVGIQTLRPIRLEEVTHHRHEFVTKSTWSSRFRDEMSWLRRISWQKTSPPSR